MSDDELDLGSFPAPKLKTFSRLRRSAPVIEPPRPASIPNDPHQDQSAASNSWHKNSASDKAQQTSHSASLKSEGSRESPASSDCSSGQADAEEDDVGTSKVDNTSPAGQGGSEAHNPSSRQLQSSAEDKSQSLRQSPSGSERSGQSAPTGSAQQSYWDEDDALQALLTKAKEMGSPESKSKDEGTGEKDMDKADTAHSEGSCSDSEAADAGSYKSESEGDDDGEINSDDLLGDAPRGTKSRPARAVNKNCIGFGSKPVIVPMDDVLAKVRSKAAAAIARAAARTRPVTLPSAKQASPAPQNSGSSSDLLIASDDEEEQNSIPAVPLKFAIGSETQQEFPVFKLGKQETFGNSNDLQNEEDLDEPSGFNQRKTPQKNPFLEMGRRIQQEQKQQTIRSTQKQSTPLKAPVRTPEKAPPAGEPSPQPEILPAKGEVTGDAGLPITTALDREGEDPADHTPSPTQPSGQHNSPTNDTGMANPEQLPSPETIPALQAARTEQTVTVGATPKESATPAKDNVNIRSAADSIKASSVAMEDSQAPVVPCLQSGALPLGSKRPDGSTHLNQASDTAPAGLGPTDSAAELPSDEGNEEDGAEKGPSFSGANQEEAMLSEDEASYQGSSSGSEEEESEGEEEESPGARERAMAEARQMLKDSRSKKRRREYMEDEAEMSEDGGHSEDGQESEEDNDHNDLLEDLIGYEKERKGDERRRAEAHAAWLEKQDDQEVKRLMEGIQNGFKKRPNHGILGDDEDGSLADARRRRAAIGADEDAESDESASESSDSEEEEEDPASGRLDAEQLELLSDGEEKENLQRYQNQKLLRDSQDEEAVLMELVDQDSQALLDSLNIRPAIAKETAPVAKPVAKSAFAFSPGEVRRSTITASFLGRTGGGVSNASRQGAQQNTKSYIFGRDESNGATVLEGDNEDDKENRGGSARGPTSFAGIKRSSLAKSSNSISFSLLDKLGPNSEPNSSSMQDQLNSKRFDVKELMSRTSKPSKRIARTLK